MFINYSMLLAILPQILLVILGGIVLILELVLSKDQYRNIGWVTAIGMAFILLLSIPTIPKESGELTWGGMIKHDWIGYIFTVMVVFGAGISALFAMDFKSLGKQGGFFVLIISATLGMSFMASAADLVLLFVAIETSSLSLYILASLFTNEDESAEAGFKYFLFGALTSTIMLYGFSLLYGFSGSTNIYRIAESFRAGGIPLAAIIGSLLLVLVGFTFKISGVPFHFWAPDVYQGAPTPVSGFLSTASKAAGFVVLARVLAAVFQDISLYWGAIIAAIAVASMTIGNLLALTQKNIKRMLAYSSIAHAGYALIGLVTISRIGLSSMVLYLIVYLVTNLAAFGIVSAYGRIVGSDELSAYYGMSRRSPWLALALLVALLSLAGMPPLGGFIAKVFVFAAAVDANMVWLAVVGVLNAIIGLYYYLTVLKYVYLYRSEDEDKPLPVTRPIMVALIFLSVGIILLGTLLAPWFDWATTAAASVY
ncbi:MAG: NADH-quinone oxidoreductase subunit N [Anaerolineales bacterium]|jgi:NADH-quinone oxidoreductase subunit N